MVYRYCLTVIRTLRGAEGSTMCLKTTVCKVRGFSIDLEKIWLQQLKEKDQWGRFLARPFLLTWEGLKSEVSFLSIIASFDCLLIFSWTGIGIKPDSEKILDRRKRAEGENICDSEMVLDRRCLYNYFLSLFLFFFKFSWCRRSSLSSLPILRARPISL